MNWAAISILAIVLFAVPSSSKELSLSGPRQRNRAADEYFSQLKLPKRWTVGNFWLVAPERHPFREPCPPPGRCEELDTGRKSCIYPCVRDRDCPGRTLCSCMDRAQCTGRPARVFQEISNVSACAVPRPSDLEDRSCLRYVVSTARQESGRWSALLIEARCKAGVGQYKYSLEGKLEGHGEANRLFHFVPLSTNLQAALPIFWWKNAVTLHVCLPPGEVFAAQRNLGDVNLIYECVCG